MNLILRYRCWRLGVCYRHMETKEADSYGPAYCQMCVSEARGRWSGILSKWAEDRMALIQQLRRERR